MPERTGRARMPEGSRVGATSCVLTCAVSLSRQGDANRSYSDDDRSSCNFDEDDKQKDSPHLSGIYLL